MNCYHHYWLGGVNIRTELFNYISNIVVLKVGDGYTFLSILNSSFLLWAPYLNENKFYFKMSRNKNIIKNIIKE